MTLFCLLFYRESISGLPLHDLLLSTSCNEGLLSWRPPLGTISLVFTPIVTSGLRHQHIRLCILVEAFYSSVEIYEYNNNNGDVNRYSTDDLHFRNLADDLTLLTTADDSDGSLEGSEICITGDDVREELVLQLKGNSGAPGGQLWGEFTMSYDVEIRETESNIITRGKETVFAQLTCYLLLLPVRSNSTSGVHPVIPVDAQVE